MHAHCKHTEVGRFAKYGVVITIESPSISWILEKVASSSRRSWWIEELSDLLTKVWAWQGLHSLHWHRHCVYRCPIIYKMGLISCRIKPSTWVQEPIPCTLKYLSLFAVPSHLWNPHNSSILLGEKTNVEFNTRVNKKTHTLTKVTRNKPNPRCPLHTAKFHAFSIMSLKWHHSPPNLTMFQAAAWKEHKDQRIACMWLRFPCPRDRL